MTALRSSEAVHPTRRVHVAFPASCKTSGDSLAMITPALPTAYANLPPPSGGRRFRQPVVTIRLDLLVRPPGCAQHPLGGVSRVHTTPRRPLPRSSDSFVATGPPVPVTA
eukprot:9475552-Pyramimonas_sp.AAC.1